MLTSLKEASGITIIQASDPGLGQRHPKATSSLPHPPAPEMTPASWDSNEREDLREVCVCTSPSPYLWSVEWKGGERQKADPL